MSRYYVNNRAQNNGDHEVHTTGCNYMPSDKIDLGDHDNCRSAVQRAKTYYNQSNGCYHCSNACHTS